MKKLTLFLLLLFTVSSWSIIQKANAQVTPNPVDYQLPYPGILPDHPLYPLKQLRDRILLFLTNKPVKKVETYILLADKNLVMGQILWEKAKYDLGLKTFAESEQYLLKSAMNIVALKREGNLPPGLSDKVELSGKKHGEIILVIQANPQNQSYFQTLRDVLAINHQATSQIESFK